MTLLKLRCFPKIFITCSDYSKGAFSSEHLSSEHLFLDTCFTINYFFDERDQSVIQYFNFFCSHAQVFGHVVILKNDANFTEKIPELEFILNKVCRPISSLQLLLRKTPEQAGFFCELPKTSHNHLNLLQIFHQTLLLLKYFTKVKRFGIVGKLLPSGASLYTFSSNDKK